MLELDAIRLTASRHGFREIQFNETSRVVAFETTPAATPGPKCRINVYYTTGTVATCLDHPRSGKTQPFRRDQTPDDLNALFRNPRRHTGVGYFRAKSRQDWRPVDGRGRATDWHGEEWRRRAEVEVRPGRRRRAFATRTQANRIAALCGVWHRLRFSPPNGRDLMTGAEYVGAMPPAELEALNAYVVEKTGRPIKICEDCNETGCKCTERIGSWCSLMAILMKVGKDLDGIVGIWNMPMHETQEPRVQFADATGDQAGLINCPCAEGIDFRQRHSTFLEKLERQFRSLPAGIRRELLVWFTSKYAHGFEPFLMKPDFDPEYGPMGPDNFPCVGYGSHFCSNAIMQAHHEYGEMAHPEGSKCCNCHGI